MAQERADAFVKLRTDDVLETAGLGVRLGIVNSKSILEETFGQSMPSYNTPRSLTAYGSELRFSVLQFDQMPLAHAA